MRRILSILLCFVLCLSFLAVPVSAYIPVTYYNEEVYAGGILDMMAFVDDENLSDYSFRWQFAGVGSDSWVDLDDNANYKGTKTNHLQVYTKADGDYEHWDEIPFRCLVTKDGESNTTPTIYMHILPYDSMLKAMKNKGIGLYEPSLTNVTDLYSKDDQNYTASAFAGSNIQILCGGSSASSLKLLENSDVQLKREIKITENGKQTVTGDSTSYIPYTIGNNAVTIEATMRIIMAGVDKGVYQTKTIKISTTKPTVTGTATANTDCSLLRYTYNESQKLASIPKGASVEVLSKEGSYYQVFYNNFVGYVGTSLLNTQTPSYDPVIQNVDVTIPAPVAGEKPSFNCNVLTAGCQLYKTEPVTWYDTTAKKFLTSADTFTEGHSYDLAIWLSAKSGYKFQVDSANKPKLTGTINGNLPPFVNKAYEQDPEEVVELTYTFHNVKAKEPEQTHTCAPVLVERIEPTCTEAGHKAYYRCGCGMHYADAQGKTVIDPDTWGVLPATGHTPSDWRITGAYHYKACTTCGEFLEQEDHRWSPTYLYQDKTGHAWICADCKTHSDVKKHTPGPAATDKEPQVCKDCGYIIQPAKNHTHKLTKVAMVEPTCTQEGCIEYYRCDGCSVLFADKDGKQEIPDSRDLSLPALGHTVSETWYINEEYHWRTCTVCDAVLEETKMLHEPENGICATCDYVIGTEPVRQTEPEAEPTPEAETKPSAETASPTETVPGDAVSAPQTEPAKETAKFTWAAGVMIGLVCFGAAITATVIILKQRKKERMP